MKVSLFWFRMQDSGGRVFVLAAAATGLNIVLKIIRVLVEF